jgi:hypothetical protein
MTRPTTPRCRIAWVVRETNAHIRQLAKSLRDETPVGFFCESGCMEIVMAIAEYDAPGGAWLEGHRPTEILRGVLES